MNPILNGPYQEPANHYRTLGDGTLDYGKKEKGRRPIVGKIDVNEKKC